MSLTTSKFIFETTKSGKKHDFEVDFDPPDNISGETVFMKLKNVAVESSSPTTSTKPMPVLLSVKNLPQPVSTISKTNDVCTESRLLGCFKTGTDIVPQLTTTIKKFPPVGIGQGDGDVFNTKVNGQYYGNETYNTNGQNMGTNWRNRPFDGSLTEVIYPNGYSVTTGLYPTTNTTYRKITNQGELWGRSVRITFQNPKRLVSTRNWTNATWQTPPMEFYILGSNDDGITNDVLGIGYGNTSKPGGWNIVNISTNKKYTSYTFIVTKVNIGFDNFHFVEWELYCEDYVTRKYPPVALLGNTWTVSSAAYGKGTYRFSSSNGTSQSYFLFNNQWFQDTYFTGPSAAVWNTTTGDYTGTVTTLATNGTSYLGAWVQLQLPVAIMLTTVTFVRLFSFAAPSIFVILGSNDENNWDVLFNQTSGAVYNPFNYFSVDPTSTLFYTHFRFVVSKIANAHSTCNLGEILLFGAEEPQLHTESNKPFHHAPRLLTTIPEGHTTLNFSVEQLHQEQLENAFNDNTTITADIEFEIASINN